MTIASLHPLLAAVIGLALLLVAPYVVAVSDLLIGRAVAGMALHPGSALADPLRRAALLLRQESVTTERPDAMLWALAPAAYGALAVGAFAVVPVAAGVAIADVPSGIVLFGALEALAIVAIFLHGWSTNSPLPLIAAYRFVAIALSYELLSMFVLIAAAIPAESLQVGAIVASQDNGLWNLVRQPLGLPLWLIVTLGVTFWGPLDLADSRDLAGGTSAEASGPARLAWILARGAMLVTFSAMGAAVFLGGWSGPVLPGAVWMLLKTLVLVAVALGLGHLVGRFATERTFTLLWVVLLPLAFLDLAIAGVGSLL